jgi:hypothetical protein
VVEDWDAFGMFYNRPDWAIGRVAIGGAVVAAGIVLELWFGSRSSKAERKIRDWYSLRVAELNLKAEELELARATIEQELVRRGPRRLTFIQQRNIGEKIRQFNEKPVNVFIVIGDTEIADFANDILTALTNPGMGRWKATIGSGQDTSITDSGIIIEVLPGADGTDDAMALCLLSALHSEGVVAAVYKRTNRGGIMIGNVSSDHKAKIRVVISKHP